MNRPHVTHSRRPRYVIPYEDRDKLPFTWQVVAYIAFALLAFAWPGTWIACELWKFFH